ncbi:energy transducer TonB [Flagellimonas sp. HMM57]|uniref:energy transducer TonB n=1 Tax=unclassified Flagellimonas TaxID=2644544 RepID=UPI0013D10092|nr:MULTISPECIES: energy transducer TonB [unclassified Flagellimonas]UII77051.1 energy transducer TonB [Flagellimonas sp. HMM57]
MKPKKNPNADIGRNSSLYFMIGLTSVLFVTWQSLEVKTYEKESDFANVIEVMDDLNEDVPITETVLTAPPPPPPAAPDVIEIIEDVEDIEETIIESTESSQEVFVEDAVSIEDVEVGEMEEEEIVPFAIIENVPVFPGCENLNSEEERKACFNRMVQEHVKKHFKYPPTALEMGITGKVYVQFVIDSKGRVTEIKKRGPDRLLEDEAARIIAALPTVKPGVQRGKAVKVNYGIPINFVMQ